MPPLVSGVGAPRRSGPRAARAGTAVLAPIAALLLAACGTRASSPVSRDAPLAAPQEATTVAPKRATAASIDTDKSAARSAPVDPASTAKATSGAAPLTPLAAAFDALVTAEALFPDPALRALYRVVAAETREEQRVYGFELEPQPGMEPTRHFHLVSIAISAAKGPLDSSPTTLAGPDGTFNELAVRTSDGRYDVSVSEGNLLPDSVDLPAFDLTRAARAIADRYAGLRVQR